MITLLTEKKSVAHDIANVIGATKDTGDWYEGSGYRITWCYGHLLELDAPASFGKWEIEKLPIIPESFGLRPLMGGNNRDKDGKPVPDYKVVNRLQAIKQCFLAADSIICATDAGREGQLIFDEVYRYLNIKRPVKRLWISSLTEQSIREGLSHLEDNDSEKYTNLATAGRLRNEADWIVGINATRAVTLASGFQHKVLSVGRVQTPTLAMICKRYIENKLFKPEPFWYLEGISSIDGVSFKWRSVNRFKAAADGVAIRDKVILGEYIRVKNIETERVMEPPPLLHDITSLQQICNARFGMTPDETLDAAQSLYEKKYLSYPRTGSRYIPHDVFDKIPDLLQKCAKHPEYGDAAYRLIGEKLNTRSVDDTKITDHHALLPTEVIPTNLEGNEAKVYDIVLSRMIEAFSPVCVADVTSVTLEAADTEFATRGRKIISSGWKSVASGPSEDDIDLKDVDEIELSMRPLPPMKIDDNIYVDNLELVEDKTKPKPLLTDATLLASMKNAGRGNDDKQVVSVLKDIGIGTPATRADIIKSLVLRGYVTRIKKKLIPTDLGMNIYRSLRDMDVSNVEMTAKWEMSLNDIADGVSDESKFSSEIRTYTEALTKQIISEEGIRRIKEKVGDLEPKCPRCGKSIRIGEKSAWCPECNFTIWRTVAGKTLSEETIKALLKNGKTSVLKGFTSKSGKTFDAALKLDKDGKLSFE
jgi:DNA topoisomerase-3